MTGDSERVILADLERLVALGEASWAPDLCHLCQRPTRGLVVADGLRWCPPWESAECLFTARGRLRVPSHVRYEARAADRTEQVRVLVEREAERVKKDRRRAEWLRGRTARKLTRAQIEFFQSAAWMELRRLVIDRAKGLCERCNRAVGHESNFDIHHLTYERFGGRERLDDLQALCGDCHLELTIDGELGKAEAE